MPNVSEFMRLSSAQVDRRSLGDNNHSVNSIPHKFKMHTREGATEEKGPNLTMQNWFLFLFMNIMQRFAFFALQFEWLNIFLLRDK